jgi:hypothetical protein
MKRKRELFSPSLPYGPYGTHGTHGPWTLSGPGFKELHSLQPPLTEGTPLQEYVSPWARWLGRGWALRDVSEDQRKTEGPKGPKTK